MSLIFLQNQVEMWIKAAAILSGQLQNFPRCEFWSFGVSSSRPVNPGLKVCAFRSYRNFMSGSWVCCVVVSHFIRVTDRKSIRAKLFLFAFQFGKFPCIERKSLNSETGCLAAEQVEKWGAELKHFKTFPCSRLQINPGFFHFYRAEFHLFLLLSDWSKTFLLTEFLGFIARSILGLLLTKREFNDGDQNSLWCTWSPLQFRLTLSAWRFSSRLFDLNSTVHLTDGH